MKGCLHSADSLFFYPKSLPPVRYRRIRALLRAILEACRYPSRHSPFHPFLRKQPGELEGENFVFLSPKEAI